VLYQGKVFRESAQNTSDVVITKFFEPTHEHAQDDGKRVVFGGLYEINRTVVPSLVKSFAFAHSLFELIRDCNR
jgi:ornithine carbamoyltransferase